MLLRPEPRSLQTAPQARSPFVYRIPTRVAITPVSVGTEFSAQVRQEVPTALASVQDASALLQVPHHSVEPRVADDPDINSFAGIGLDASKVVEPIDEVRAAPIE